MTALLTATPEGLFRDGRPHQIISGALHYFRVQPEQWRDRLRRLKAMGCDTVETYVAWNVHQPSPDRTVFDGIADLGAFLDLAAREELDIIVRPGPYICAEWENGGLPGWILADRNMRLRCMDPAFLELVDAWFDELIPVIAERQASRGGRVVAVQVENEYGSYGDDRDYLEHLRDGLRERGIEELLVTSDGPARMWLTGGTVDGAWPTVNFGSRADEMLAMAERELPDQPQMCMEFWNGWFDHWDEEHHTRSAESAAAELRTMLERGMSVNFYMAHGGTNWGMSAGANTARGALQPTTTSYDYDAPIAEDGTLTEKFRAFRDVIAEHRGLPPLDEHLDRLGIDERPAAEPGRGLAIERTAPLRTLGRWRGADLVHSTAPSFEDLGLERGLLLYRRDIEVERVDDIDDGPTLRPLALHGLRDRACAFVDGHRIGPIERPDDPASPAEVPLGQLVDDLLPDGQPHRTVTLEVLVENLGRPNFGPMLGERKGITGGIWQTVRFLNDIEAVPLPLEEMGAELALHLRGEGLGDAPDGGAWTGQAEEAAGTEDAGADGDPSASLPLLVGAAFDARGDADAWLDVSGCGHGVAYVNDVCIGRYWSIGPQHALYVPAPLLRAGRNDVVLLELDEPEPRIALADGPIWSAHAPVMVE